MKSKKGSTIFLRFVVFVMGIGALALCIFALPSLWRGGSEEFPAASRAFLFIILIMEAAAIPFFVALWQTLKLLRYVDEDTAFSEHSVKALRNIKYCAVVISVLYFAVVPFLIPIAEADDAPGLVVYGFAFACTPLVIAVFAAVLEKLLKRAIEIKSENELTV